MPTTLRRTALALPFLALFAVAACKPAAAPATDAGEHHGKHHGRHEREGKGHGPRGPMFLVHEALHDLDLTPEQRAKIESAKPAQKGDHDGHPGMAALAAGVRAGKVDVAAVMAEAEQKHAAHEADVAKALTVLHDTLTKEQRRKLVDHVREEMAEHEGKGPHGEGHDHHGPHGEGHGPMRHLFEGVLTTDAQRDALKKAIEAEHPGPHDPATMKQRFEAMKAERLTKLEAFAADAFDAKAMLAPPKDGPMAGGPKAHAEHFAKVIAAMVPVLEPAQREELAKRLEAGPKLPH